MKERPILFSAPMVRAILAGTKTQTRRVCKPAQSHALSAVVEVPDPQERGQVYGGSHFGDEEGDVRFASPYGQPGDRLWVRETWLNLQGTGIERVTGDPSRYAYAADTPSGSHGDECRKNYGLKWRPSIHMPRWASRITLEITSVRVERLQNISEADARAEGIVSRRIGTGRCTGLRNAFGLACDESAWAVDARQAYGHLWDQVNGPGSWEANPWVWVVEFRRVEGGAA